MGLLLALPRLRLRLCAFLNVPFCSKPATSERRNTSHPAPMPATAEAETMVFCLQIILHRIRTMWHPLTVDTQAKQVRPSGTHQQMSSEHRHRNGDFHSPPWMGRDPDQLKTWAEDRGLVRSRRLELPRVAPLPPQGSASTKSATTAQS